MFIFSLIDSETIAYIIAGGVGGFVMLTVAIVGALCAFRKRELTPNAVKMLSGSNPNILF